MYLSLYSMYVTMSISIGLYPNLDLWNANKLHYISHVKYTIPKQYIFSGSFIALFSCSILPQFSLFSFTPFIFFVIVFRSH